MATFPPEDDIPPLLLTEEGDIIDALWLKILIYENIFIYLTTN